MTFVANSMVPELWCRDFAESLRFYTETLGFSVGQHKPGSRHAYVALGASQLMITSFEQDGTWETGDLEPPFGRGINFSIRVGDCRALYEDLTSKGVVPFVDFYTIWYWRPGRMEQFAEFAVQDPDGYLLRFSQSIGSRDECPEDPDFALD